jgi:cysteinyl-tRNA synthetase
MKIARLVLFIIFSMALSSCTPPSRPGGSLLYWLSTINLDEIRKSSFSYVVIDYSSTGAPGQAFTAVDISSLKESLPSRRKIFCYFSIGEAEAYRYYWHGWKAPRSAARGLFLWNGEPPFLGPENPEWKGNYLVDYRQPGWQKILLEYLDIILEQGFDGVCLDKVDSYETLELPPYQIPQARQTMIELVARISAYGKSKRKGFKVYVQNGEELAWKEGRPNRAYLDSIDGICREDIFIADRKRRSPEAIHETVNLLSIFKKTGKIIFSIDYPDLKNKTEVRWVTEEAEKHGYIEYCAPLGLDRIESPR